MKKQQYIVFGLNRFGTSVARTLAAAGNEVVAAVSYTHLCLLFAECFVQ